MGLLKRLLAELGLRRKADPEPVRKAMQAARDAGIELQRKYLVEHHRAGGRVEDVVDALVEAARGGVEITLERAMKMDLAGPNPKEMVRWVVNPRVSDVPASDLTCTTSDGVRVGIRLRVTTRLLLERLADDTGEDAMLKRVREGAAKAAASKTYDQLEANPDLIARELLTLEGGARRPLEVLSVDVASLERAEG